MRLRKALPAFLLAHLLLAAHPALAQAPQSAFLVRSFPGATIGNGETRTGFSPEWTFSMSHDEPGGNTNIFGEGPGGSSLFLNLEPRLGDALTPGPYENASDGAGAAHQVRFSMGTESCATGFGRFVVLEADFEALPARFAVNFEQWCDGDPAPTFGEIRFNSAIPLSSQVVVTDPLPDAFALEPHQDPVMPGTMVFSNSIRIYGTNAPVPISITGGEYSLNGAPYTSAPGAASDLDLIRVRTRASDTPGESRIATFDANGVSAALNARAYGPGMALTGLYIRSAPADYIGQGITALYLAPRDLIQQGTNFGGTEIQMTALHGEMWSVGLAAPGRIQPGAGTFEDAIFYPSDPGDPNPQIRVGGLGHGCEGHGRFVVHEALYNPDGSIVAFAADFEQSCDGSTAPLVGEVRFNSTVPFGILVGAAPAPYTSLDFSGDGKSDLVLENADGRAAIWLMNGATPADTAEVIGAATGWSISHVADFDSDGKGDLAWRHTDGRVALYLMDGTAPATTQQILNAGAWSVAHTADLNGDGTADLVFAHTDGSVAAWTMDGTAMTDGASIMGAGSGWSVIRSADFDGDGKGDLLWRHADGRHAIWLMNGVAPTSTTQIVNAGGWTATHTPDLDGDGRADIVWQHADGSVAAWLMNGTQMASGSGLMGAGSGWSVARAGDFDGSGTDDLLWQHSDGRAAIYLMNGLAASTAEILGAGGGWIARRVQDMNDDGKADIAWQNADGSIAVWLMDGLTQAGGATILGPGGGWSVSTASQ